MHKSMPMATDNHKIQATVTLMKKNTADFNKLGDAFSGVADTWAEVWGHKVSLQLVSADKTDPKNELGAKIGEPVYLEHWTNIGEAFRNDILAESEFTMNFDWNIEVFGTPGAILVQNPHHGEFYLKTVELKNVPGVASGRVLFICNSWVYNQKWYQNRPRVFFSNKTYLPHEMPEPLRKYREEELKILRGDRIGEIELKEWDRVYDYALYNDLGNHDGDSKALPPRILGGSIDYPYPRRGRTGRPRPFGSDPRIESRNFPVGTKFNIYVPRDEQFSRLKMAEFNDDYNSSIVQGFFPTLEAVLNISEFNEFTSLEEVNNLYLSGKSQTSGALQYPEPQVIKADKSAWRTDEEFAREMVAGLNPLLIQLLKEFPPTSKLDPAMYHHPHSRITKQNIEFNLDGLKVEEALESKRLFILDHHDTVIPYLYKINKDTETRTYASRTLLFLEDDGTLKPVAIELSLPVPIGDKEDKFVIESKVYTPAKHGVEGSLWQLAKAYVAVVDTGHHQLLSHWLNTHAAIEPVVIATNRQLSVVHPIYKLLHPHFRDTMAINALAREILVNAGGLVEQTFYPGKYSMEMSSEIYKSWNFLDQALPVDLKKRGIAVADINSLDDLDQLLTKDYPYAVDGLKIWFAIEKWVREYSSFYYNTDEMVQQDPELQAWWKELREEGHGDKKDEPWWPKMQTREELIKSCTIIIWIASALHAAVNFGQYAYAGYSPNRPTGSRKFMPEKGTQGYEDLTTNFEKAFFETIIPQRQCLVGITLVEVLSNHSSDEMYLGDRDHPEWTTDAKPLEALEAFQKRLAEIEQEIISMNMDKKLKNRVGPVNVPYTLLYPKGEVGLSGKGIPNSISI